MNLFLNKKKVKITYCFNRINLSAIKVRLMNAVRDIYLSSSYEAEVRLSAREPKSISTKSTVLNNWNFSASTICNEL